MVEAKPCVLCTAKRGKFEIQLEEEESGDVGEQEPQVDKYDDISLDSLIEPKLV